MRLKKNQEEERNRNDLSNLHGTGRQSEPSGGISAFRGGVSNEDATQDYGVPTDKFVVADATSDLQSRQEGITAGAGKDANDDLQGMYDRIIGANPAAD